MQRDLRDSAGSLFNRAWELQKYTILLMYCSLPPARGREYRELQLCVTDAELQLWQPAQLESNWLLVAPDHSKGLLYVGSHKTSKHTGIQRIELSSSGSTHILLEQLVEFVCRDRPQLLQGHTHDWLFVVRAYGCVHANPSPLYTLLQNHAGLPYDGADCWTKAIQSIFLQHKNVSISTNALRASYVTHLLSGDESAQVPEHVLTQAARAMRHSRHEQLRTYDKRTSSDKVARAVNHTATQAATALFGPPVLLNDGPSTSTGHQTSSSKKRDVSSPAVGDVVGMAEDSSTDEDPVVLLGKVVRVYPDTREFLLAWLKPIRNKRAAPTFKLSVGKDTWVESFDSLVFPLDVVYDEGSAKYTLRTPFRDIHDHVYNSD